MKIKFIPLLFALGLVGANAQITVADQGQVYIASGTKVFSGGTVKVLNTATAGTQVTNYGEVRIKDGVFQGGADNLFTVKYTNSTSYGQMIIDKGTSADIAEGSLTLEHLYAKGANYAQFGTPFTNYAFADFASDMGAAAPVFPCSFEQACTETKWYQQPIFQWNNDRFRFDPINPAVDYNELKTGEFYSVRMKYYGNAANFNGVKVFNGTPYVAPKTGSYTPKNRDIQIGVGGSVNDLYRVNYYTYLTDPFSALTSSFNATTTAADLDAAQFANRLVQLVNPYAANLDMKVMTNNYTNIQGIAIEGNSETEANAATATSRYKAPYSRATVSGGALTGDKRVAYIPPRTMFIIKATSAGNNQPMLQGFFDPASQTFSKSTFDGSHSEAAGTRKAKALKASSAILRELTLELYNKDKTVFYNRTYLSASPLQQTGTTVDNAEMPDKYIATQNGVFTLPEAVTGGVATGWGDSPMFVNFINDSSEKIAIPVWVNAAEGTEFSFSSILTEDEKIVPNFSNSADKFYLHDKELKVIKEITPNFNYTFTLAKGSYKDRFEIFWRNADGLGIDDTDIKSSSNETTIYKDKSTNQYLIKFNKDWKEAEVTVFNVVGQLISSEKKINTQNNYIIPLRGSSNMYIVKITNEKGETVTKKIVK